MSSRNAVSNNNINSFIGDFLSGLDARQKEVISRRYGLDGEKPSTLQAVGKRYNITRERVRQIEAVALAFLKKKAEASPYFKSFTQLAVSRLKGLGGLEAEANFLEHLKKNLNHRGPKDDFENPARFLLELSGKLMSHRDKYSVDWHHFWYLGEGDKKQAHTFVDKLELTLNQKKQEVIDENNFGEVLSVVAKTSKLSELVAKNYLAISKKIGSGPFGAVGLLDWPEVNPKTARDWAYLILKKEQQPLHFSKISETISHYRKNKRTNLQTVHNELIKDDRFVLVGRGLYGLKEAGLVPGTAREIIAYVLKNNGPLPSREVVRRVKEQRFFKEGTIMINLQNRKHFECLSDGRYFLREA